MNRILRELAFGSFAGIIIASGFIGFVCTMPVPGGVA